MIYTIRTYTYEAGMETVIGKYILRGNNEPSMKMRRFTWRLDEKNNAVLQWEWPTDRTVKLMLVFEYGDEEPDIASFLRENREHAVVARDLADRYQSALIGSRRRYLVCPAYFNEQNAVVLCQPALSTDWLYRKIRVTGRITYKPLRISRYKQVTLSLRLSEGDGLGELAGHALRYGVYEGIRLIGLYPLDNDVAAGRRVFYIKKNQIVKFIIEEGFAHLLDLTD